MKLSDIRAANRAAGLHFFDPESMRFFWSKIENTIHEGVGGIFFVTSEQMRGDPHLGVAEQPRRWTVRQFDPESGTVETADGFKFQQFNTSSKAHDAARRAAADH